MAKFQIKAGFHTVYSNPEKSRARFGKGDIIESTENLARTNPHKYVRVPDDAKVSVPKTTVVGSLPAQKELAPLLFKDDLSGGQDLEGAGEKADLKKLLTDEDRELFTAMSLEDLKEWAKTEEVALGKAKTKEQILEVIFKK